MTPRSPSRLVALLLGGLAVAGNASGAAAQSCAMCGSAFGAEDPLGRAFSWSILFLMAAPYTIAGTVGTWLFFTYRRARHRRRAAVITLDRERPPVLAAGGEGEPL